MNTIQEHWESYKKEILPRNASPVQISEAKKAFYGGAAAVMSIFIGIGDDDSITEDAGAEILET